MQVNIPHTFGKEEALKRVKAALGHARERIEKEATLHEERWDGDTLYFDVEVQGQRVPGTFTVYDDHFDLYAKLPLMLRMFEGKIEQAIKEQAHKLI